MIITNPKSVAHFLGPRIKDFMPITGRVIDIQNEHHDGIHRRPYLVRFDDGRESWWAPGELKK